MLVSTRFSCFRRTCCRRRRSWRERMSLISVQTMEHNTANSINYELSFAQSTSNAIKMMRRKMIRAIKRGMRRSSFTFGIYLVPMMYAEHVINEIVTLSQLTMWTNCIRQSWRWICFLITGADVAHRAQAPFNEILHLANFQLVDGNQTTTHTNEKLAHLLFILPAHYVRCTGMFSSFQINLGCCSDVAW